MKWKDVNMKKIREGIVFSNDIERILKGNNALQFNYVENNLIIPNSNYIEVLRKDFDKDVNIIFNNKVIIIKEEDMLSSVYKSILDVYKVLPHCIFG